MEAYYFHSWLLLTEVANKLTRAYVGPTMDESDSNKYFGLVKAKFSQVSSVDKLISTNKQFQNSIWTQNGDRLEGLFQVGSTEIQVKQKVNL